MSAPSNAIPNQVLLKLPKEREAISYRVGCDAKGQGIIVKWCLWNKRTEVSHLPPHIASYVRDCLRNFLHMKEVTDCRARPEDPLFLRFENNLPIVDPDDWDAKPTDDLPRQAHGAQVHCFDDAVFLAFLINKKDTVYRILRLDPRICHELVDEIDVAEPRFVDVRTAVARSHSQH